jgi:hypothetical protein
MADDLTDKLVIENLKRAANLIVEAAHMAGSLETPESGVQLVTTLWRRAFQPRMAAQEFTRLGGVDIDAFRAALSVAVAGSEPRKLNLGYDCTSMFGWCWILHVDTGHGIVPVAFNREQAEAIHRRLNEALDAT